MFRTLLVCSGLVACLAAPQRLGQQPRALLGEPLPRPSTTPVPILKQISKSNEDGSYTYGFEAADGSFKLETRRANGEVFGKYGYIDANGDLKTVEYGASKLGFNPVGEGITVAPPTLNDNSEVEYYDYVDVEPTPAPAAPVQVAPARLPTAAPRPITDTQFQNRFADFDARIAALFNRA